MLRRIKRYMECYKVWKKTWREMCCEVGEYGGRDMWQCRGIEGVLKGRPM